MEEDRRKKKRKMSSKKRGKKEGKARDILVFSRISIFIKGKNGTSSLKS
jgi:hypothetical protein